MKRLPLGFVFVLAFMASWQALAARSVEAAPAVPVISSINGNVAVVFTGTADPNVTVAISTWSGTVLGSTTSTPGGDWLLTLAGTLLHTGDNGFTARAYLGGSYSRPSPIANYTMIPLLAPTITASPANLTVEAGSDVNFSVTASASPDPTYQWQRQPDGADTWSNLTNDSTFSNTTEPTLTITYATSEFAGGQYRCVVSNGLAPAISDPALLALPITVPAPTITGITPDTGSSDSDGLTSTEIVTIHGTAPPNATIQLIEGRQPVYTNSTVDGTWSFSLETIFIGFDNFARTFVARAIAGNTTSLKSAPYVMHVDRSAPNISMYAITGNALPSFSGATAANCTVQLSIVGGDILGNITADNIGFWSFTYNGAPLAPGNYAFSAIAMDLAGNASPDPAVGYLTVVTPESPGFSGQPKAQTVAAGRNAIFSVAISGAPMPALQWQSLAPGSNAWVNLDETAKYVGVTTTNLTVVKVGANQNGMKFRCVITNFVDSATSNAVVLKIGSPVIAPSIKTQPTALRVRKNAEAQFSVKATGTAPLSYHWQRNKVNLVKSPQVTGVTEATLSLHKVSPDLAGSYRVIIANSAGNTTSASVQLTVK